MKTNINLNQFEAEIEYFDYLVTTVRKPHHRGVLKNIRKRIKALSVFISESENFSDVKAIERATEVLQKFESLKERFYLIYPKK